MIRGLVWMAVLALVVVLVFMGETFTIPQKSWHGFGKIARRLLSTPDFQKSVFLVSSDTTGEGVFISEVAMRERRPGHVVLRGTKVLGTGRWDGGDYVALYTTPGEMMRYLESIPVGVVVIDLSIPASRQFEHQRLLKETLEAYPQRWKLIDSYPLVRRETEYPDALWVYRMVGNGNRPVGTIRIDMHYMLNKFIEKTIEK